MGIVQSRGGESDGGVREVFVGGVKAGVPHHSCQPSLGMGSLGGPHARTGSMRSAPRQPMPDTVELERRFTKVLVSILICTAYAHPICCSRALRATNVAVPGACELFPMISSNEQLREMRSNTIAVPRHGASRDPSPKRFCGRIITRSRSQSAA